MGRVLTGFIWFSRETGGRLMSIRKCMFGFHKMRGMYFVAELLLCSEECIRFVELVIVPLYAWVRERKDTYFPLRLCTSVPPLYLVFGCVSFFLTTTERLSL